MVAVPRPRVPALAAALLLAPLLAGCSAAYWTDRGRDFLDVPTITFNSALGVRARVGPVHAGLIISGTDYGLRGGALEKEEWSGHTGNCIECIGWGGESFDPKALLGDSKRCERKGFDAIDNAIPFLTIEIVEGGFHPYWTQIEAQASFLLGLRLGLNPGEFADFLVGFSTLDIYGDDVAGKKTEPEKKPAEPAGVQSPSP